MKRKIKTKMIDLLEASDSCTYEMLYYLDTKTGEVVIKYEEGLVDDEGDAALSRAIEEDEENRFIPIPVQDSRETLDCP